MASFSNFNDIEDNTDNLNYINPFYVPDIGNEYAKYQNKILYRNHKHIYIVCSNADNPIDDVTRELFYEKDTCFDELKKTTNMLRVVPAQMSWLSNRQIRNGIVVIPKKYIQELGFDNIKEDETVIVYLMLEVTNDAISSFIKDERKSFDKLLNIFHFL